MIWHVIILILGLGLIIFGGNAVTDGAVTIARRFKMSGLMIGLTIVAVGSSTPDLVVSLFATAQGKASMAIGNVVGAGIFDLLLVIGITALIHPVKVASSTRRIDMPLVLMAAAILFFCGDDTLLDGGAADIINRSDGLMLLCFFILMMAISMYMVKYDDNCAPTPDNQTNTSDNSDDPRPVTNKQLILNALYIIVGLGALVVGGNWIVSGASDIARHLGWSEALIGLTIVGIGSSLPDLATSAIAAIKGQSGLAVGNVIGSCIIDFLFVIGTCATVAPLNSTNITWAYYGTLLTAAFAVWAFTNFNKRHIITRAAGVVLVLMYVAYNVYLGLDM